MKKIIVYLTGLLFVVTTAAAQQWKTFSTDSILFTAKYPANWINKVKEGKRVFFTSPLDNAKDNFKENINIRAMYNEDFSTTLKIKETVPEIAAELQKAITDYTEESQRNFTWNGADAVEIIYTGYAAADLSLKARFTQWFCFYKSRLYTLTFAAAADNNTHNTTAKKIMESVKFK
jgi:hypothetical protein